MNQIQYQYVPCELCGEDQTKVLFEIEGKSSRGLSVLTNGHEVKVDQVSKVVQCQCCGLIYVNPRIHLEAGTLPYSPEAEEAYFQDTCSQRTYACQRLVERFSSWYGARPDRLLDIGCGDGVLLDACERAGIDFVGTEVSPVLVERLRNQYGNRIRYAEELASFPSESFDVVALINVIEHLEKPGEIVAEARRLLKPGGVFLVHAPNMAGLPARLHGKDWHQVQPLVHLYYFTPVSLKQLLKKAGLTPVGRFSLLSESPIKRAVQVLSDWFQIYLDNGLGIAARRE